MAAEPSDSVCPHKGLRLYMSIGTNLLYDAAALPTVSAEFYVGRGWSVVGSWTYGWWDNNGRHRYWRAYGGHIGLRGWFGRKAEDKPLTGHHLGLIAGAVTYDFEFGGRGYMGGRPHGTLWDRCQVVCALEYGYSLPLSRRLNLDLSIACGYLGGRLIEYRPENGCYVWQSDRHLNWMGPVNAEVSLIWLIGPDNYNRSSRK